jgi:cytochrome c5
MKKTNKITAISTSIISIAICATIIINGCKTPESISSKSGAQLWGENCNRCHNAPDAATYSDDHWDAAIEHMRQKALLTNVEITKIRSFLKSAN